MNDVAEFLMQILLYAGGPIAIAGVTFKMLGEKWIENKFAAQLRAADHAHDIKLQDLKQRIDSALNRTIKIQDREFAVLPEAWSLLCDAHDRINLIFVRLRTIPGFNGLSPQRLEEHLAASPLSEAHKQELRQTVDKDDYFLKIIIWYQIHDARTACLAFRGYIRRNSIFIRPSLRNGFIEVNTLMWDAIISREVGEQAKDHALWIGESKVLSEKMLPLITDLEGKIQALLHKGE